MVYINKNKVLRELEEIIKLRIGNDHHEAQNSINILEQFRQRVFLESTIEKTLDFNRSLNWNHEEENVHLVNNAEELLEVFKLRSDVFGSLKYENEFPDSISGLNFDTFDHHAAIVFCKTNNELTGTCRLIFDTHKKLPTDEKYSLDYIREEYSSIGEVSRLVTKQDKSGLNLEFKYLTRGIYRILENNPINASVSAMKQSHFKLYSKFGGFKVEKELKGYGHIDYDVVVTSWNPKEISPFFKKHFLE